MLEKLKELISVKKIIALTLTIVFCVLVLKQLPIDESFKTIFNAVIFFYFGQSTAKEVQKKNKIN